MSVIGRNVANVNRIDRLYALVEALRAIFPRCATAKELAERFGVSVRTVERDVARLQRSGLPIALRPGEGYRLAEGMALPPLNLTPEEAAVVAVALGRIEDERLAVRARSALSKIAAALAVPEEELTGMPPVARVLRIGYADRKGAVTSRDVEPRIFLGGRGGFWYLVAWCRMRRDVRVFRLDRITSAVELDEAAARPGGSCADSPSGGGETVGGAA
jgi:predicted DNA-binding transcriptional regulator YafY